MEMRGPITTGWFALRKLRPTTNESGQSHGYQIDAG